MKYEIIFKFEMIVLNCTKKPKTKTILNRKLY